jgi:YidC/Oxa1 family membrane protein insertase
MKTASSGGKGWYNAIGEPVLHWLGILGDGLFDNFGLAIIVFTLIVRLILLPLTLKQFRSARELQDKMKTIKPKQEALKKKYKNDSRKQMQETMKLYKEAGISPLGCLTSPMYLTMLIQMPVLIAMFAAVRLGAMNVDPNFPDSPSAVEAMGLSVHFLWLDLTTRDPFWILPVVVSIMMFLSQRLTMDTTADDPQAKMMRNIMNITMPVLFFYICAIYPSGLALYWFVSTLLNLGVQYYVKREWNRRPAAAVVAGKKAPEPSPKRATLERDGGRSRKDTSQVSGRQAISPEKHRADISTNGETSDWKEHMQDGQHRSKRKNRRRGRRERPKADGPFTGGS